MADGKSLTDVLDHMDDRAEGNTITLGEIIDSLGRRSYGPLFLAFALIALLPTGAIPGVPTLVAAVVVLLAGQLLVGRSSPWVPRRLKQVDFSRNKFQQARGKIEPVARGIDRVIKPRLERFVTPCAGRVAAACCLLMAAVMPPLELVPFAAAIPSLAIALFGIGLSARDGLVMLIALLTTAGALAAAVYWLAF